MPAADADFEGGPQKTYLRTNWDLPIIRSFRAEAGRPLRYFGMPGPAIEDVRQWETELEHVTAVELLRPGTQAEEEDRERLRRLNNSLLQQGLDFQILRGWVEDVLINGHDIDQQPPQHRDISDPAIMRFRYDVVNLDFCGGAGYGRPSAAGKPKRIRALQELFRRQQGMRFVLLLTLNVRDRIDDALTLYLRAMRRRVAPPLRSALDWYANCGDGMKKYRLKAAIPAFLQHHAESECFDVECFPPIAYSGTANATMVHFVVRCTPTSAQLHSVSKQDLADLIRLPLLVGTESGITLAGVQHNGFDWQDCHDRLAAVPQAFVVPLQTDALARIGGPVE
jgi:hypothetical protein